MLGETACAYRTAESAADNDHIEIVSAHKKASPGDITGLQPEAAAAEGRSASTAQ